MIEPPVTVSLWAEAGIRRVVETVAPPLRAPSQLEELLELCARRANLVPQGAQKLDHAALPAGLQSLATVAARESRAWRAWTDLHRVWFFVAAISCQLSRECGCPVLKIESYAEDGQLTDSDHWLSGHRREWRRYVVRRSSRPSVIQEPAGSHRPVSPPQTSRLLQEPSLLGSR